MTEGRGRNQTVAEVRALDRGSPRRPSDHVVSTVKLGVRHAAEIVNIARRELFRIEAHSLAAQLLGLDGGAQQTSLVSVVT
jgi:hypothetical protein